MKESNDYKIEHIEKPSGITNSPYNMIPHLPERELFFDSRHWTYGFADNILPFSLTTRISANNQQFLKVIMNESKNDPQIIQAGTIVYPDHSSEHQQDFVQHADGISRVIPAGTHASTPHLLKTYIPMADQQQIELPAELKGKKFRIRKLTPRECFRLMGVDDKDIDKIQTAGISNSGQYRLAGNSIVVDVLFHLFRKMFIDTDEPDFDGKPTQLTLF